MALRPFPLHESDQLFFLHIPKTGGMTLKRILKRLVEPKQFHQLPIRKFDEAHARDLGSYRCIRAHWDYGFFRVLPRKPVYLTMLRHPVARMLSLFGMIRHKPDSRWYTDDIHDFITMIGAEQLQVHFLAGAISAGSLPREALLEVALTRLDECAFFGITEQFDRSVRLLGATLGWEEIPPIEKRNEAAEGDKPKATPAIIAHIEQISQLDMQLYRHALQAFEDRAAAFAC